MNTFKGLQAASLVSFASIASILVLAAASVAACTDDPGTPGADAGPDVVTTTDGGADSDAAVDPCAFGEPNDTRETSKAIDLNKTYAGLCVSNPDPTNSGTVADEADFFEITAPATDLAGGYVELSISNVAISGLAEVVVTSSTDNGVIFDSYTTDAGGSIAGWFTVTPGAKYKLQVNRFGGPGDRFSYDLLAKYTPIVDTFEPNNTKETAKPIVVGTPITASPAASDAKAELQTGDDLDFYKVTLTAGTASVKMTNVPAGYLCDVQLLDPTGVKVFENYQTTPAADCTIDATDLTGGDYILQLGAFSGTTRGGPDKVVPAYVTGHYTLAVTQ